LSNTKDLYTGDSPSHLIFTLFGKFLIGDERASSTPGIRIKRKSMERDAEVLSGGNDVLTP